MNCTMMAKIVLMVFALAVQIISGKLDSCWFADRVYANNTSWSPSQCDECNCLGGQVACRRISCQTIGPCEKGHTLRTPPGSCCPSCKAISSPHTSESFSIVQFKKGVETVDERDGKVEFPVVRSGDLSYWTVVRCYTTQGTASEQEDFGGRPRSEDSEILFSPGEEEQMCSVVIIDDSVLEGEEYFHLNLGLAEPSDDNPLKLGEYSVLKVKVLDEEDAPSVQLEMSFYVLGPPLGNKEEITRLRVYVIRSGDLRNRSSVRISTRDKSAKAGTDYHQNSKMLQFGPGAANKSFHVDVVRNGVNWARRSFVVLLDNVVNTTLGPRSSASIIIPADEEREKVLVFPSPPVVVSLLYYDDAENGTQINPSPGYPLVCIHPCSFHHPKHAYLTDFCTDFTNAHVTYSWEVGDPSKSTGKHTHFEKITLSPPFTTPDKMVLDSVYFQSNFIVRCIAQPWTNYAKGIPAFSEPVKIDSHNAICGGYPATAHPRHITATLNYIGPSDADYANRIHVHVEFAHQDGIFPLISTAPLPNLNTLLLDAVMRKQHQCSNMFASNFTNETGFLTSSTVKPDYNARPYQFDESVRGTETVRLYQHLDLNNCKWEFDGWFTMSELATVCGGIVSSDFQRQDSERMYATVKVPLYVSYLSSMEPSGWSSVEHRSEIEASFHYNGVLWKTALHTEMSGEAKLQMKRVATRTDGRLIIEFQTKANFRGLYVLEHAKSEAKSRLLSSDGLVSFNLSAVWMEHTFDGPIQRWKAISSHSLKDYTGKYSLELLPCLVGQKQEYSVLERNIACTVSSIQRFQMPISFQQSPRPVPVVYSLNTVFQLLNNERIFLANPFTEPNDNWDMDFKGPYAKGETVYGRVMWQADQNLDIAYKLTIQQVYICSGHNGYVPMYDPTGELYNEGSHFGCLEHSSKLKYRFLLLDRSNRDDAAEKTLKAKFASDDSNFTTLESIPGVDGFVFQVDTLYSLNPGHRWYLQVLYTIGPSARYKRSTLIEEKSVRSRNGTNMHVLLLTAQQASKSSPKEKGSNAWSRFMPIVATSLVVISVVFLAAVILCVVAWRRWRSLKRIEMRLQLKQLTTDSRNFDDRCGQSATMNGGAVRLNSQVCMDSVVVRTLPVKIHNDLSEGTEV